MAAKKKSAPRRVSPAPKGMKLKATKPGPQKKCAKNSYRFVEPPGRPEVRIVLCCPVGKWKPKSKVTTKDGRTVAGKCTDGLKVHARKHYKKGK